MPSLSPSHLRTVLWIDAITALAATILILAAPTYWSTLTGLPVWTFYFAGAIFVPFVGIAFLAVRKCPFAPGTARTIMVMNFAWATISLIAIAVYFSELTPLGLAVVAGQTLWVVLMGDLQWLGLRGTKHSAPPVAA